MVRMATSLFLFLNHTRYDFELQFGTKESSWVLVALVMQRSDNSLFVGLTAGAGAATGSGCGTQDRHCAAIW